MKHTSLQIGLHLLLRLLVHHEIKGTEHNKSLDKTSLYWSFKMTVALRAITHTFSGIFRSTIGRGLAAAALTLGLRGSNAFADEELVNNVADEAKEIAAKKLADAKENFHDAIFEGDTEAMMALFNEFLLPIVIAGGVLFVGWMIAGSIGRKFGNFVSKRVDLTLGRFAGKAVKTGVFMVVLMAVLGHFGFNLTSLAAVFAAVGFAVGMALTGTLGNFAAGIMLLIFRPFKIGDYVKMAGSEGVVEAIDLFTTQLNTPDNRRLIVPNGEVFGATIENVTHNPIRRVDVSVGCDYNACLDKTRETLEAAVLNIPNSVSEPAPQVYLVDLGDSAVNWQLRVWCKPADYWAVRQDVTAATKKSLDAARISIPFPQMDVHVQEAVEAVSSLNKPRRRDLSSDRMSA